MPGYELIDNDELDALKEIFTKSNGVIFAHGHHEKRNGIYRVRDLENELSKKFKVNHSQCVTSGTIAQLVAMLAFKIRPGDEVITQAHTFVATVESIIAIGAKPVIVDIDDTYNMCPIDLENKISNKTKLIVPVHMLGNPCDMGAIKGISLKYNIPILEDACEALGAKYKGEYIGTIGNAGVFSLDYGKTITAGEGGIITTNDNSIYEFSRDYHDHGHQNNTKYSRAEDTRQIPGMNYRMTEMQGAIGLVQLNKLDHIINVSRKNKIHLKSLINESKIRFRKITDSEESGDALVFSFENKKTSQFFLKQYFDEGLITKNIPDALRWHFSGYWEHMFDKNNIYNKYSNYWIKSKDLLERSVSIPIFINTSEHEIDLLSEKINKILKSL